MKTIIVALFLFLLSLPAMAEKPICDMEFIEGTPKRPYVIVSPISASGGAGLFARKSQDQLFETMKKKACKLNADAVIKLECHDTKQSVANVYTQGGSAQEVVVPSCSGLAVNWK